MTNNIYTFKISENSSTYNLMEMMSGKQKFGFLDSLRVTWISLKNCINLASYDERQEMLAYKTINKIIKATSKCFDACQLVLPSNTSFDKVENFIRNDDLISDRIISIANNYLRLKSEITIPQKDFIAVTKDKVLDDLIEKISTHLNAPKPKSPDFTDAEKEEIIQRSKRITKEIHDTIK